MRPLLMPGLAPVRPRYSTPSPPSTYTVPIHANCTLPGTMRSLVYGVKSSITSPGV